MTQKPSHREHIIIVIAVSIQGYMNQDNGACRLTDLRLTGQVSHYRESNSGLTCTNNTYRIQQRIRTFFNPSNGISQTCSLKNLGLSKHSFRQILYQNLPCVLFTKGLVN